MPSRRRHRSTPSTPASSAPSAGNGAPSPAAKSSVDDAAERFAAALRESERRDQAAAERRQKEQADKAQRDAEIAAHANDLATAQRDLERAIDAVRAAKRDGKSQVAADAAWKQAKARVIELETGAPPAWAPKPVEQHDGHDEHVEHDVESSDEA